MASWRLARIAVSYSASRVLLSLAVGGPLARALLLCHALVADHGDGGPVHNGKNGVSPAHVRHLDEAVGGIAQRDAVEVGGGIEGCAA
jgi:hypothetical protein